MHTRVSVCIITLLIAASAYAQTVGKLTNEACTPTRYGEDEILRISNNGTTIANGHGTDSVAGGASNTIAGYRTLSNSWVITNTGDDPCDDQNVYLIISYGVSSNGGAVWGAASDSFARYEVGAFMPSNVLPVGQFDDLILDDEPTTWNASGSEFGEGVEISTDESVFAGTWYYYSGENDSIQTTGAFALRSPSTIWTRVGPDEMEPDAGSFIVLDSIGQPVTIFFDYTSSGIGGMSADGSMIVGSARGVPDYESAFIAEYNMITGAYDRTYPCTQQVTMEGCSKFRASFFHDVSADGSVAVGRALVASEDCNSDASRPIAYYDGTVYILPAPDGDAVDEGYSQLTAAYATNANGRIIVGSWKRSGSAEDHSPVLWIRNGTQFDAYWLEDYLGILGVTLPSGALTTAVDTDETGNVIVGRGIDGNDVFSWITNGVTLLPTCGDLDFNNDTIFPDSSDLDDLLAVISGGPSACSTGPGLCDSIDINRDGIFPDTEDQTCLLTLLAGSSCPNCQ